MSNHSRELRLYWLLLQLYPAKHRADYQDQMLQTFADMLGEQASLPHAMAVWWRVGRELPMNIVSEYNNNREDGTIKTTFAHKRTISIIVVGLCAVAGITAVVISRSGDTFQPTTLSVMQSSTKRPACLQKSGDGQATVSATDSGFIGNAAASSIIDVPAGTNVDVYFKTFSQTKATGSAVYSGTYGTYNFLAEKTNKTDTYVGGWQITSFEACN